MKIRLKSIEPRWMLIFVFFVAGFFLGLLSSILTSQDEGSFIIRSQSKFKYINPLLATDFNSGQFTQNTSLTLTANGIVEQSKRKGQITEAGIYFRDIGLGQWMGINDNISFSPGKLLKIPIMVVYLKLAENNPAILENHFMYRENSADATTTLIVGQIYTANELIEKMILESDDGAANLLFDNIEKNSLDEVFSDLGINFKEDKINNDYISLKLYTLFFRVLYNSTYLNREYSEKALKLLVEAPDTGGLFSDLPKSLDIANKLGMRSFTNNGKTMFEKYDCGIVYYPYHPYMLCAVARGDNADTLQIFLADIGNSIYREMAYKYK